MPRVDAAPVGGVHMAPLGATRGPQAHRADSRSEAMPELGELELQVWPELAIRALGKKKPGEELKDWSRQSRVFFLAHALDAPGRGILPAAAILDAAQANGLKGLSRSTLCRVLQEGDDLWWRIFRKDGGKWIELRSLAKVAAALRVERLARRPVLMKVPKSLKLWRAMSSFSLFARPAMMSQARLADLTGRTDRAVRGYANALGSLLKAERNAVDTGRGWRRGDPVPDGHCPGFVDGELVLLRVLPNCYELTGIQIGRHGRRRNVNASLDYSRVNTPRGPRGKRLFLSHRHDHDLSPRQNAAARARICKTITKRMEERREGDWFAYSLDRRRSRSGARLWDEWSADWPGCAFCSAPYDVGGVVL